MDTEEIKELVESRAWSEDNARVSVRAEHKCEYCGLDFFASFEFRVDAGQDSALLI